MNFVPKNAGVSILQGKADLAFTFSPNNAAVQNVYNEFEVAHPRVNIGFLTDAYTMTLLVHYALEIEASDGNQGEARPRLATFHTAAPLKLKNFFFARSKSSELRYPLPARLDRGRPRMEMLRHFLY